MSGNPHRVALAGITERAYSHRMKAATRIHPAVGASGRALWKIATFPVVAAILLLAPVVYFVCGLMFVGGIIAAVLFEVSAVGPRFPFLQIAGIAALFGLVAVLYYALVAFLIRD
jgi:uncharacterized membrane protein